MLVDVSLSTSIPKPRSAPPLRWYTLADVSLYFCRLWWESDRSFLAGRQPRFLQQLLPLPTSSIEYFIVPHFPLFILRKCYVLRLLAEAIEVQQKSCQQGDKYLPVSVSNILRIKRLWLSYWPWNWGLLDLCWRRLRRILQRPDFRQGRAFGL